MSRGIILYSLTNKGNMIARSKQGSSSLQDQILIYIGSRHKTQDDIAEYFDISPMEVSHVIKKLGDLVVKE
jgi:predicted transcriptional regulator